MSRPKLYSYCVRNDAGAAPNPFWGICTLVICKPVIRRSAQVGDWIVGLGSVNSSIGDVSDKVVYAMKVTSKMTMEEYDQFCQEEYPKKLPNWRGRDYRLRVGDCVYDFSHGHPPKLRLSVHNEGNRKRDLGGLYALLSTHFYYFGDKPVELPAHLQSIIKQGQGHKSDANDPYVEQFVEWIEAKFKANTLYGEPQLKARFIRADDVVRVQCARNDLKEAEEDEEAASNEH
ncbi:MAG: hypothetical protein HYR94_24180 [Chloroflexi bacterium]|nr:hypothetical protein [Chloroflexota bacterium]